MRPIPNPHKYHQHVRYIAAILTTAMCTVVARILFPYLHAANLLMIYILGVVVVAFRYGRGPSIMACILSAAAFDFFFTRPYFSLVVSDTEYLLSMAVMLVVAITISTLATRVREHAEAVTQAESLVETERIRNALLSSLSHDLRTPLATITGAATSLIEQGKVLQEESREELAQAILEESERLNRLVGNLLDMTKLESGTINVKREWQSMEELVGTAMARLDRRLAGRKVVIDIAPDMPLVAVDGFLVEQVIFNLVENAVKYSPGDSEIGVSVQVTQDAVHVEVSDRGQGVAAGEEMLVFEKFYRSSSTAAITGTGLGLAIAKGIVLAHGGWIAVHNREGGGAVFEFALPRGGMPPPVEPELEEKEKLPAGDS